MREAVLARRSGPADGSEWAGSKVEGIGNVVEAESVGQLREQQADDVAPRAEGATLLLDAVLTCQARDEVGRNEIAQLVKQAEPALGWLAGCRFHYTPTLWQGRGPPASLSFTQAGCGTAVVSIAGRASCRLRDGHMRWVIP